MAALRHSPHHVPVSAPAIRSRPVGETPSPAAVRTGRARWRDPRLAVGLALVSISVLTGARVLAGADDTVAVLAADGPLAAGQQLEEGNLVPVRVRFAAEADADRYVPGDGDLPEGAVLLRPVGAGELVPRAALGSVGAELVELPLAVDLARVPSSVRAGSVVDVWVTPTADAGARRSAELLLGEVPVLATSRGAQTATSGVRQVVVGVSVEDEERLEHALSQLEAGALLLVRRPG